MYEYLLPVGSVVKVKNVEKKMVILGVIQRSKVQNDRVFDYIAVPYPEGQYDPRMNLGFDNDDIEEVVFRGFEDDERKAFLVALEFAGRVKAKKETEQ